MLLDRFVADPEHLGDLFVGQTECHLTQHFALTLSQRDFDVLAQTRRRQGTGDSTQFFSSPSRFAS